MDHRISQVVPSLQKKTIKSQEGKLFGGGGLAKHWQNQGSPDYQRKVPVEPLQTLTQRTTAQQW